MSMPAIESSAADVTRSDSLVVFYAASIHGNGDEEFLGRMKRKPDENRQRGRGYIFKNREAVVDGFKRSGLC